MNALENIAIAGIAIWGSILVALFVVSSLRQKQGAADDPQWLRWLTRAAVLPVAAPFLLINWIRLIFRKFSSRPNE